MKTRYRLRVWSYELHSLIPEVFFDAFNDEEAKEHTKRLISCFENPLLIHLQKMSWVDVQRFDAVPVGKGEAR
jgi:hypothetical protein